MLTKLGKYQIKSELGSGAMGVVYRAEDSRLGRPVALKTMSARVAGDSDLLKRFYREAQSAGKLRHPNIVTIYDIDEADGIPFIAMEFLEGESLEKIISIRKELSVVKKLDIVIQTCKGLHYAHQHGIVHRDVKPANIMVLEDGVVKIVDFGIARVGATSMTRTGMVLGTPMYMAPEQIKGQTVDARSDVFSVGVICYEFLTYISPFAGDDVPTILYKILNETPQLLTAFLPNCPPQLDGVVTRAMAKNREERYQSAEDLAFDLQQLAGSLGRHMLEVYVVQGQRSFQDGNFTLAKESLQKALEIDSGHHVAKSLLEQVQEQLYTRQRGQKLDQALRHAKDAIQGAQYDEAIAALDEVLQLDPGHAEAQEYKQLAVERRAQTQKLGRHLERAEKFLADADFRSAKTELEAVVEIDPGHSTALRMLDGVTKEIADQERMRQVRQLTQTARTYLAEKNFAGALELLEQARGLDPINIEVEALMRLARSGLEEVEQRQVLYQRMAEIQEALNAEQFEQALALAEKAAEQFPEDPQVLKLHTQAVRLAASRRKRQHVEEQLQVARDFVQQNRYADAIAILEQALETMPDDPRLASFLKTIQEAQARATVETLRRQTIREANDLIRHKDFSAAIATLERAQATGGQSPEIADLLQFAKQELAEQRQQERVRQVLTRAQTFLRQENYEEAIRLLEKSKHELNASEIENLLTTAREQLREFEQRREELIQQAGQLLQAGEPTRALAFLDAAPKAYFNNPEFNRVQVQCRQAIERATFIRGTVEQIENLIASGALGQADSLLRSALKSYPDDSALLEAQGRLAEQRASLTPPQGVKVLEDAKAAMGRSDYEQVISLLSSVNWESAGAPEMAAQANALLEEARQREEELAQRKTVIRPPVKVSTPAAPSVGDAQKRLREALEGRARPAPAETPKAQPRPPAPPAAQPTARAAVPPAPAPVAPRPVVVERVPAPTRPKPFPLVPVLAVLLVAAIIGVGLLIYRGRQKQGGLGNEIGYVQLNATPWAEIVSVQTTDGKRVNATGQTPIQLSLPPAEYVIELKNGDAVRKANVVVKPGQAAFYTCTFPEVKVDDIVDELVSK